MVAALIKYVSKKNASIVVLVPFFLSQQILANLILVLVKITMFVEETSAIIRTVL